MRQSLNHILAVSLLALVANAGERSAYVWPAPPAEARLEFVRSISLPADCGIKGSVWSRMASLLTGIQAGQTSLQKPCGVAVDEFGNVCVTDTGTASVSFYDFRHKKFHQWKHIGPIAFKSPVAVAKRQDRIFVADSQLGEVVAFGVTGHLLFAIADHLARPVGLALLSNKLFVVDSQLHRVVVFDSSGRFLSQFGARGVEPGEFNFPTHIAATAQGEILVTDSMNSRIEVFDTQGHFQSVIGERGDSSGHFSRPKGVAADSFGHIYVMDALFDNLQIFDRTGQFLLDVGSTGAEPGQFWLPAGIAISSNNEIYIADSSNHRVQLFKYIGP